MTEEQGGEQIGKLFVEIGGDLRPLDEVLGQAAQRLEAFIAKEYTAKIGVSFENTGGASPRALVDRHGRQIGQQIGQAAVGQIEAAVGKARVKDVKVEAQPKIDKDTLTAAIQGSLNGHPFKLTLDQDFIRQQVQQALGHGFTVGVGGAAGAAAAPARPAGITPEQRAEFDAQFAKHRFSNFGGQPSDLGKIITEVNTQLRRNQGLAPLQGGPTAQFEELVEKLGDDLKQWGDKLDELDPEGFTADIVRQKIQPTGTIYQDILKARQAAPQEQTQPSTAFVAQVAKKIAQEQRREPSGPSPSVAAAEKTFDAIRRSPIFATPVSLKELVGGLAKPEEAGAGGPRSSRYGGRGFVREPLLVFGPREPVGPVIPPEANEDVEADIRAEAQLGTNRANVRRLRGLAPGADSIQPGELEGLLRTLERGGLRNLIREVKTGNLRELTPRGNTEGELLESERALTELRKRSGNRRFTLPNIEGQVQFVKPKDVVADIVRAMFGEDVGNNILETPEFQRAVGQAIRQGGRNKPFDFIGGGATGAARLGGTSVEAAAREQTRLQRLIKETDEAMGRIGDRIEELQGSGRPTDRLEDIQNRLGLRGQRLRTELEAITPNIDRPLSAQERREYAAASAAGRAASRANIEAGVGLSPLEAALKEEQAPEAIAATIAHKMREGILPAYETLLDRLSTAVEQAVPRGEAGENQFSARYRAFAEESQALAQEHGLLDEGGRPTKGTGEDRRLFDALIAEAKSTIFTERRIRNEEGERAVDLLNAGAGKGRRPKTVIGSHVDTARVSVGGAAVVVPDYARPTTSLDTELATLRKKYDDEARRIAQERLDALQAARAKSYRDPNTGRFRSTKGLDFDKVGIEDVLYAPRIRTAGGGTTPKEIKPDIRAEVESTTDVGKRVAEIRRIQAAADEALKSQGPAVPLATGRRRGAAAERAAYLESLGLEPDVLKEALEVSRQNLRGKRTPYTKAGREVPTGDQSVEAFAAAAEGRDRYPVRSGGGAGSGGGSTIVPPGGGGFAGFPVPLPVLVVNDLLRVALEGAGGGGPQRAASAADAAEEAVQTAAAVKKVKATRAADVVRVSPGGVASTPTDLDVRDINIRARRERQEAARKAREEAAATRAAARTANRPGSIEDEDLDVRASQFDLAENELDPLRARLRAANRRVPKRGFTASVTDLITATIGGGGFEEQLRAIGRAENEFTEIRGLLNRRATLTQRRETLLQGQAAVGPGPQFDRFGQRIEKINKQLVQLEPAIVRSRAKFEENIGAATGFTRTLKSFTAAGIGAAFSAGVGSLSFGLGLAVTGPLIQAIGGAFTTAIGTAVEQALGFPTAETTAVANAAQLVRAAGGREEVARAQLGLQTGNNLGQVGQVVIDRASIEAGNQALAEQGGLIRAAVRIQKENAGRPGGLDAALTQSLGGFLGGSLGGIPSIDEIIGGILKENPAVGETGLTTRPVVVGTTAGRFGQPITEERQVGITPEQDKALTLRLEGLNKILEKGTGGVDRFTTAIGLSEEQIKSQAQAFRLVGAENLAQAVEQRRGALTENGQVVTDAGRIAAILDKTVKAATKLSPEDFLEAQAPQLKAQQFLNRRQLQFQLEQAPIQEGLARSQQPLLPATAGFAPQDAARFKTELGGVQTIFNQLTQDAADARAQAVEFFRTAGGGQFAGQASQFASALQKSADYGQQIADIQLGVSTAQAAFEAKQYSVQIDLVRRSLQDAKGLTGQITNDTRNLGVIERQQFELQRQSQALQLGQTQRQINFNKAIAGFVAPGTTPGERAARIAEAKLEADYAQKQLDIQKKLFGLGGKQFQITADRNVRDLTNQLGLLQAGREVTLKTAVAQKQIQALTALQARENDRIQAFYQAAVNATGQVMQLEAQLVANTEVGLNKVGNLVLTQFRKVYAGLIRELSLNALGGQSGGLSPDERDGHASGILGLAAGPTDLGIAGEAGNEAIAIIRNPRPFTTGAMGGGVVFNGGINITINGGDSSDPQMADRLARAVEQRLNRKLRMIAG